MAEYFTLDPYYERYELGVVAMEYKTVYGRPDDISQTTILYCGAIGLFLGLGFVYVITRNQAITSQVLGLALAFSIATPTYILSFVYGFWLWLIARNKLRKLRQIGILLDGTLISFEIIQIKYPRRYGVAGLVSDPLPFAKVIYQFVTPDSWQLHGEQRKVLYIDWKRPIPSQGTPIRVLYADPETYVML